jgi:hypothetical protein
MGPFSSGDWTFNSDMIYLGIIVFALPFGFKVCVGTYGDCEYGTMGGKVLGLLQRFLNLLRRWRWIWLGFDLIGLGVGVVLCRVCNLWHCEGIGYLWNW